MHTCLRVYVLNHQEREGDLVNGAQPQNQPVHIQSLTMYVTKQ